MCLPLALVLVPVVVLLAGCPGSGGGPLPSDSGGGAGKTITVNGRVVDFETCLSAGGCKGAADLTVALFYDNTVASDRTSPDGAFTLKAVPSGARVYLLVSDTTSPARFLSTLQGAAVTTEGKDVFGVELYALQIDGGLYGALGNEASLRVETHGLYLGQALTVDSGSMKAYQGASVRVTPTATVRFVRDNPRFNAGEKALFEATRAATGVFGQFIVATDGTAGDFAITPDAKNHTFTPTFVPLAKGFVTIGLHRASKKPGTQGSDGGGP